MYQNDLWCFKFQGKEWKNAKDDNERTSETATYKKVAVNVIVVVVENVHISLAYNILLPSSSYYCQPTTYLLDCGTRERIGVVHIYDTIPNLEYQSSTLRRRRRQRRQQQQPWKSEILFYK